MTAPTPILDNNFKSYVFNPPYVSLTQATDGDLPFIYYLQFMGLSLNFKKGQRWSVSLQTSINNSTNNPQNVNVLAPILYEVEKNEFINVLMVAQGTTSAGDPVPTNLTNEAQAYAYNEDLDLIGICYTTLAEGETDLVGSEETYAGFYKINNGFIDIYGDPVIPIGSFDSANVASLGNSSTFYDKEKSIFVYNLINPSSETGEIVSYQMSNDSLNVIAGKTESTPQVEGTNFYTYGTGIIYGEMDSEGNTNLMYLPDVSHFSNKIKIKQYLSEYDVNNFFRVCEGTIGVAYGIVNEDTGAMTEFFIDIFNEALSKPYTLKIKSISFPSLISSNYYILNSNLYSILPNQLLQSFDFDDIDASAISVMIRENILTVLSNVPTPDNPYYGYQSGTSAINNVSIFGLPIPLEKLRDYNITSTFHLNFDLCPSCSEEESF